MPMRVASLASGSSGNSYYIECPEGAVIVDAGLSGRALLENLVAAGGNPAKVQGIIITHDHNDHVAGAGVLQRRHGWKLWMTRGTRDASGKIGKVEVDYIRAGEGLSAAGMNFEFYKTPHDAVEPILVTISRKNERCGICTDLGHPFPGLAELLEQLDFVFLESNFDPDLLAKNPRYPYPLKARIRGDHGHITNQQAAELVAGVKGGRLRKVVLSHLSEENNRPELAMQCFRSVASARIEAVGMRVGTAWRHKAMLLSCVGQGM